MTISKTNFLEFLFCPKNIWLKLHKPDLLSKFTISDFERHLAEQGNEVESYARNLFPGGIEVVSTGDDACTETLRLMTTQVPSIFQSTFIADGFIARNDMLVYNRESDRWDLYEVKATSSLKEQGERDHIEDVGFQISVLKRANVKAGRCYLIHLNKEYIRAGDLDLQALFKIEDVTEKVSERLKGIEEQMEVAKEYLSNEKEPGGTCECIYQGRKKHCTTFKHSNPHVPEYSVHDISRITEKKLSLLVEGGIFDIQDIPEDFNLSDNQKNQILAHRRQKPLIDLDNIRDQLSSLTFPLYFFDYEAFGPAIPIFNGYGPYKHIPFQFSLHVLEHEDADPIHIEFLHEERTDPSEKVVELLEKYISQKGTVIAWNKSFEAMVNREIGTRLPKHISLIERINNSLYDLMDIFRDQHYVHHGFKGSASIKKVLPVLVPELRYSELDINEGGQAADAWWTMVSPSTSPAESKEISANLRKYCGLDTYAMYAIWKHLKEII